MEFSIYRRFKMVRPSTTYRARESNFSIVHKEQRISTSSISATFRALRAAGSRRQH
ncbi:hypothetical protein KFK09_013451 [Dendrobium nobile]|uniref:Uncharacterized protein n=1 Tax=Dendrobium nobile TaxID=94219 RepID=A0A8T3BD38_DENNO|nr:hypothetical protein KFK09_013451 [Dendrobium nobile]